MSTRHASKIPDLAQALDGHFDDHHAQMARAILGRLDLVEQSLVELDAVIAAKCAPWQHEIDLLQTIPGVGEKVAQVIVAETGADMPRFPSAAHLAAWVGVAPGTHESAGKRTPTSKRHGNKWVTAMLVEAAGSVARMHQSNLSAQHARIAKRRGNRTRTGRGRPLDPGVGLAHGHQGRALQDLGADWLARRNDEAHTRRLVAQLERLGHTVQLDPVA